MSELFTQKPADETLTSNIENSKSTAVLLWELVRVVIIAFVLMLCFRVFVAETFKVSGSSMVPNLHDRDYLIIDKVTYRFSEPKRGDVIVFKYPKDPKQYFVKRIIGLPGETVQIQDGKVYIFNEQFKEGFVLDEDAFLSEEVITRSSNHKIIIGENDYFVLGDNREFSSDSRVWGILPKHDFVGKVFVRVYPFSSFKLIDHPSFK